MWSKRLRTGYSAIDVDDPSEHDTSPRSSSLGELLDSELGSHSLECLGVEDRASLLCASRRQCEKVREYNLEAIGIGNIAAPALVVLVERFGRTRVFRYPSSGGNLKGDEPNDSIHSYVHSLRGRMTSAGVPVEPAGKKWEYLYEIMREAHRFVNWPSAGNQRRMYVGHYCSVSIETNGLRMCLRSESNAEAESLTFDFQAGEISEEEARAFMNGNIHEAYFYRRVSGECRATI